MTGRSARGPGGGAGRAGRQGRARGCLSWPDNPKPRQSRSVSRGQRQMLLYGQMPVCTSVSISLKALARLGAFIAATSGLQLVRAYVEINVTYSGPTCPALPGGGTIACLTAVRRDRRHKSTSVRLGSGSNSTSPGTEVRATENAEANASLSASNQASSDLTARRKHIAEFWPARGNRVSRMAAGQSPSSRSASRSTNQGEYAAAALKLAIFLSNLTFPRVTNIRDSSTNTDLQLSSFFTASTSEAPSTAIDTNATSACGQADTCQAFDAWRSRTRADDFGQ